MNLKIRRMNYERKIWGRNMRYENKIIFRMRNYKIDKNLLIEVLSYLSPREQKIIKMYFGLEDYFYTFEEIGKEFGVTRERIRQILDKSIEKIREYKLREQQLD
jgi:DNA-directed RNA polymerase sigma subunit (sigma70/sigma32)